MLRQILRFYREAPRLLAAAEEEIDLTLAEYLEREGYSDAFVEDHLVPVAASIWSASRRGVGAFPAQAFVRFFQNHGLLSLTDRPTWRTITGGSARYVEPMVASFRHAIHLSTPVTAVQRDREGVTVTAAGHRPERFARIVLACHADQALQLLTDATPLEQEVLGAFPYAPNDVVLHSDPTLMPRSRAAWASWNYHRLADDPDRVVMTYNQNRLQRLPSRVPYLVTLNRTAAVAADRIQARFTYHHPQYDPRAVALQPLQSRINCMNHTHFCGAYWGYGFHEDGVTSALRVARAFGEDLS
jgi:predicted NAD/FAD-binding protein